MRIAFLLLAVFFLSNCASKKEDKKPGEYILLSAGAFHVKSVAMPEAILLDVRSPEEIAKGKINGAVIKNYFDKDFSDFLGKLDKDLPIFIYSQTGERSSKAAAIMIRQGFQLVMDLQGGYQSWNSLPLSIRQSRQTSN